MMTGQELDKRMREILLGVTYETAWSSVVALVELGFLPSAAFELVRKIEEVQEKEK